MTKSSWHEDRMLKKFMKKSKARGLKDYKKHDFLQFIVKRAMKREKIDINTPNHIDLKIANKVEDIKRMKKEEEEEKKMLTRESKRPIVVDQLQTKKPVLFDSQPRPLMEKEAHFKEVVDIEEEKLVLVSNDVDNDDYEKEVMNKKTAKNNNKRKNTCKLPVEPPNEEICKLMLEKISEIKGKDPVWLTSKIMTRSDQDFGLGRFYIPKCDELEKYLIKYLRKKEMDIVVEDGIHCRAVDQNGEMWDLVLRYYDYLKQYALVGGWKNLLSSFGLLRPRRKPEEEEEEVVPVAEIPDGKIELWCFRLPVKDFSVSFALRITRL